MHIKTKIKSFVESPDFLHLVVALITLNSIILALQSYPYLVAKFGYFLSTADEILLSIFVCELLLYLFLYGPKKCLTDPWYVFDATVICVAIFSVNPAYSSLRALRVLRILRLISAFPHLRRVVEGLLKAIPDITSIFALLGIVLFVGALMATNLYGSAFPEFFGSLQGSIFSMFQMLTTEGWPDIVRKVMAVYPYSWIFFIVYIFAATFIVLNLFIAVIVDAMQKSSEHMAKKAEAEEEIDTIQEKLDLIYQKLEQLEKK